MFGRVAALVAISFALLFSACADVSLPGGFLWARNDSDQSLLVRQSFLTRPPLAPDIKYVFRVGPQSEVVVAPWGANNSLIELLDPSSCRVMAAWESHDDGFGVLIAHDLSASVTAELSEALLTSEATPAPQITDCGGEPSG